MNKWSDGSLTFDSVQELVDFIKGPGWRDVTHEYTMTAKDSPTVFLNPPRLSDVVTVRYYRGNKPDVAKTSTPSGTQELSSSTNASGAHKPSDDCAVYVRQALEPSNHLSSATNAGILS